MSEQKKNMQSPLFTKDNLVWMLIGGVVMAIGFVLLSGGKSTDPNVFDNKQVYSTTRITIAPILIMAGLIIEIFAIFKKSKV
jgi:Protein of unknown function (DUF3098)